MAERGGDLTGSPTPLLLAVESALRVPSAALLQGEVLLAERAAAAERRPGASGLLALVDEVFVEAGRSLDDVEAFAVSIGPGSFTGLRVGVATIKGLAFGTARPVASVSSLAAAAFAAEVEPGLRILSLLDARRGEAYAALYERWGEGLREQLKEGVYTPADLAHRIGAECALVGQGAPLFVDEIRRLAGKGARVVQPGGGSIASAVGVLGARALARGDGVRAEDLVPRYVRRAEAEVKRTSLRFESDGNA